MLKLSLKLIIFFRVHCCRTWGCVARGLAEPTPEATLYYKALKGFPAQTGRVPFGTCWGLPRILQNLAESVAAPSACKQLTTSINPKNPNENPSPALGAATDFAESCRIRGSTQRFNAQCFMFKVPSQSLRPSIQDKSSKARAPTSVAKNASQNARGPEGATVRNKFRKDCVQG